jgi:hypothetical protein
MLGTRMAQWLEGDCIPSLPRISAILSLALSAVMAAAAPVYFLKYGGNARSGLVLAAAFSAPAIAAAWFAFRGKGGKAVAATLVQGLLVVGAAVQFAVPVLGDYMSARDLAGTALRERLPGEPMVTFGITDHSLDYYTGYQVLGKVDDGASLRSLLQDHGSLLVVTEEQRIGQLKAIGTLSTELLEKQGDLRLLRLTMGAPGEGDVPQDPAP